MMRTKILGLLTVGLLTASAAHGGSITLLRDTDAELRGTFMFSGVPSDYLTDVTPSAFDLSPGASCTILQGGRVWYADSNFGKGGFGLQCVTSPDDAARVGLTIRSNAADYPDLIGFYDAVATYLVSTPVFFRSSNWRDTGGPNGTFTGAFCFATTASACLVDFLPEPGTLALLGLGLVGLGMSRRRLAA